MLCTAERLENQRSMSTFYENYVLNSRLTELNKTKQAREGTYRPFVTVINEHVAL